MYFDVKLIHFNCARAIQQLIIIFCYFSRTRAHVLCIKFNFERMINNILQTNQTNFHQLFTNCYLSSISSLYGFSNGLPTLLNPAMEPHMKISGLGDSRE